MHTYFSRSCVPSGNMSKSIFLNGQNAKFDACGLCSIFSPELITVGQYEHKIQKRFTRISYSQKELNRPKQTKKSLKQKIRPKQFQLKQNMEGQGLSQYKSSQKLIRIPDLAKHYSRQDSKTFKDSSSSEITDSLLSGPTKTLSKYSSRHQFNGPRGCQKLKKKFRMIPNIEQSKKTNQILINIPMAESAKNSFQAGQKIELQKVSCKTSQKSNPELLNFHKTSSTTYASQKFCSLEVSPVKPILILQESQWSGVYSFNPSQRQDGSKFKKEQLTGVNVLQNEQIYKQFQTKIAGNINLTSSQMILEQSLGQTKIFQIQRDFAQISLERQYQPKKLEPFSSNFSAMAINQISTSSFESYKAESEQIELKTSFVMMQSNLQSDSAKARQGQTRFQIQNIITPQKSLRMQNSPYGSYSVQIPKSKRLLDMQISRTISIESQQDASEQKTSQVIYGFRQTDKDIAMQEIVENMFQSFVPKPKRRSDNVAIVKFLQLLRQN